MQGFIYTAWGAHKLTDATESPAHTTPAWVVSDHTHIRPTLAHRQSTCIVRCGVSYFYALFARDLQDAAKPPVSQKTAPHCARRARTASVTKHHTASQNTTPHALSFSPSVSLSVCVCGSEVGSVEGWVYYMGVGYQSTRHTVKSSRSHLVTATGTGPKFSGHADIKGH